MGFVARRTPWLLAFACLECGANPGVITVNDFGDAGPGDCTTTCTLRDAINTALATNPVKSVIFSAAGGWPQTIVLTQGQLTVNNATASRFQVVGPGAANLAISANNASRVLSVNGGEVDFVAVTLRDGNVTGTDVIAAPGGTGQKGDDAGVSSGGCILVAATAALGINQSDVRSCAVNGGKGGNGGSGANNSFPNAGGTGGAGGAGGAALGGAIATSGNLTLTRSTLVSSSAHAGLGGTGGAGGTGFVVDGTGGVGGPGGAAAGGLIYISSGGALLIQNSTLASGTAAGGNGGTGGNGDVVAAGGFGGNGGRTDGGLLYVAGSAAVADIEFATLANGVLTVASGGAGGGGTPAGAGGQPGSFSGVDISAVNTVTALSSLVVGAGSGTLCSGSLGVASGANNLDQDNSCSGFTLHATFAQVLLPLDLATTSLPGYMPVYHGSAIDAAATCTDTGAVNAVTNDQRGTLRPQGLKCDLGAIEADFVFANGFD